MNITGSFRRRWALPLFLGFTQSCFFGLPVGAATTMVTVGDNFFSPSSVTINANDTVQWNWSASDIAPHSSTSTSVPSLWDSTIHTQPFSFSHTFPSGGTFPYWCSVHTTLMTGLVTVASANLPPTVSVVAPTNGANFSAPWTGTITANSSDSDGSVTQLVFLAGATRLGTIANPPATANLRVTNMAAGTYTLTAQATDNQGASTTSSGVTIHVLTPVAMTLSSPARLSATNFQFNYTATPGLKYVVRRSTNLVNFTSLTTNTAAASPVTFQDHAATNSPAFYRVELLPNP